MHIILHPNAMTFPFRIIHFNLTVMKNVRMQNEELITQSYLTHRDRILRYIAASIGNTDDAEDLTQNVWMRLLEYRMELNPATIATLLHRIARNIVYDYLRHSRHVTEHREETISTLTETEAGRYAYSLDSEIEARDLAELEHRRVECMPRMRRIIYVMSRYDDMPVSDISERLSLSARTVENHLRLGRSDIRSYMSAIA